MEKKRRKKTKQEPVRAYDTRHNRQSAKMESRDNAVNQLADSVYEAVCQLVVGSSRSWEKAVILQAKELNDKLRKPLSSSELESVKDRVLRRLHRYGQRLRDKELSIEGEMQPAEVDVSVPRNVSIVQIESENFFRRTMLQSLRSFKNFDNF